MARLSLSLLLLTLLAGHGAEASEVAPPVAEPLPLDHWQASDWKGQPEATQIDKQTVLFAKHDSDNYVGLAILLPDWQRSGQLWQLTRALSQLGFDTLLLLPSPQQTELDPAAEKKAKESDAFRKQLAERISKLADAKLQEGGFKLILAQGTGAAWTANLIASEQLPAPDALVLLDGFFPDQQSNQILAKEIAQGTIPTLDLYQEDGGRWPLLAAEARQTESRRSHKLNYRPYALMELGETPTRIQGWLNHLGWL
ncbi:MULTISPECIES: DUF3530 family protein [Aeromonas]|jgi:hypothetical protein|uniref:DUF3530 domain-containing protein n=1 Tax=Aeromonas veronii TaxID=654 RepID=A0A2T4N101_AERVE|nr:DUF3530 family protein [Aeromonas veronii]AXV22180.1 DUF3530 domain-containing protein [Aeromonas veronii]MBA2797832.1 DUF3530 family protein [Aeromonas veronii]MCX0442385.1 alpha/beta hydrolase family protein [Aeromonas veronii]PTH80530.1 DUF3530 domain-containing protein [Aeromonas veronii]RDE64304.1 DUF3530 family protein [Aeromonas veronii]